MTERKKFEKWLNTLDKQTLVTMAAKQARTIEELQAATKAAVPQWIHVSERLPENNSGLFLCAGHGGLLFVCHRKHHEWYRSPQMKRLVGVTHWMPLPAAPEVKDEHA